MNGVTETQIREELNRVLSSHEFRSSKRSQDFLRFVIESTLGGRADMLKERTIGIEVFGRSTDYEPSDDATVRVKAGEVRKLEKEQKEIQSDKHAAKADGTVTGEERKEIQTEQNKASRHVYRAKHNNRKRN